MHVRRLCGVLPWRLGLVVAPITRTTSVGPLAPQILLAGWGEVAHGVAMRACEVSDLEWAAGEPQLGRCTGKYYVNRKPRASAKFSYSPAHQQRLWDLLVQQTGAEFKLG